MIDIMEPQEQHRAKTFIFFGGLFFILVLFFASYWYFYSQKHAPALSVQPTPLISAPSKSDIS